MKAGFLTQILVIPVTGKGLLESQKTANELGFKMFSFNGCVYAVSDSKPLFMLSDLVDYNYNASSL